MAKKHDLPMQPWYWGDWFKATDVQSLPHDTRCVWFEMCGRMWEATERGYLRINGKPMTDRHLAQCLGFGRDIRAWKLHEKRLESAGIFSRTDDGAIYCRRIVKDAEIHRIRQEAGRAGGLRTGALLKQRAKQTGPSGEVLLKQPSEDDIEGEGPASADAFDGSMKEEPLPF